MDAQSKSRPKIKPRYDSRLTISVDVPAEVRSAYYLEGFHAGIEAAARKSESWGDECAGGSGLEIIKEGPSKGQRYGEGYYNLAKSIRGIKP